MILEKLKGGIFTFFGISILISGLIIGSNLNSIANSIDQVDTTSYESTYELVVQDGVIYMWDTTTGDVWKKEDTTEGKWEEVDYFRNN